MVVDIEITGQFRGWHAHCPNDDLRKRAIHLSLVPLTLCKNLRTFRACSAEGRCFPESQFVMAIGLNPMAQAIQERLPRS
jgi:hypothetical protein